MSPRRSGDGSDSFAPVHALPPSEVQLYRFWRDCVAAYSGICDENDNTYRPFLVFARKSDPWLSPWGRLTKGEDGRLVVDRKGFKDPPTPVPAYPPVPVDSQGALPLQIDWLALASALREHLNGFTRIAQARGISLDWFSGHRDAWSITPMPFELFMVSLVVLSGPEVSGVPLLPPSLLSELIGACEGAYRRERWGYEDLPKHLADRLDDLIRGYYAALRSVGEYEAEFGAPSLDRAGGASSPGDPTAAHALRRLGQLDASHVDAIGRAVDSMPKRLHQYCRQIYDFPKRESSSETAERLGSESDSNIRRKSIKIREWVAHHLPPGWEQW